MKYFGYGKTVIIILICMASLFSGCLGTREKGDAQTPQLLTDIEQKVFEQINDYRISKGLNPLNLERAIIDQARKHSQNMAEGKEPVGHGGFEERVRATGLNPAEAAENVATNQGYEDPATAAVEGWIKSAGHRKNIEGDFNLTGIGINKSKSGIYYFTQLFMKRDGQVWKSFG